MPKPVRQAELMDLILTLLGKTPPDASRNLSRPPETEPKERKTHSRLRVLVAEDNPVNQKLVRHTLEKKGHSVHMAANGREALDAFDRLRFDLVLMDIQMPELDGIETTARIRRKERDSGEHIPIVAMTAYAMPGDRERLLAAGMDGYVAKPVTPAELVSCLETVFDSGCEGDEEPAGGQAESSGSEGRTFMGRPRDLLARVAGDEKLLGEMVDIFLEELPERLEEIRAASAAGDARRLERAAHALKGSIGYFCTAAPFETANTLVNMGRADSLDGAAELVDLLERDTLRLRDELTAWWENRDAGPAD
jgi:CheY-like chemotaxis protein